MRSPPTGSTLLVDEAREVSTDAGPVQIVGMDFVWRDRQSHLAARLRRASAQARASRASSSSTIRARSGTCRRAQGDLVLSGHTHGGQVGLVSLGLSWTFLRLFGIRIPDHGFWARGRDRMYVHRGTGHYGFPLRLGVPSEESVLRVHRLPST